MGSHSKYGEDDTKIIVCLFAECLFLFAALSQYAFLVPDENLNVG